VERHDVGGRGICIPWSEHQDIIPVGFGAGHNGHFAESCENVVKIGYSGPLLHNGEAYLATSHEVEPDGPVRSSSLLYILTECFFCVLDALGRSLLNNAGM
jgi:hypothetical protein